MRILLLTDSYPPEIRSTSLLMYEFAQGLSKRNYQVSVVTTQPRYNLAQGVNLKYNLITNEEGIRVVRINTLSVHKVGYVKRGLAELILPILFYRTIKKEILEKPNIIVVYSPPLTLGVAGILAKKHFSSKIILNIQDLFPQNAIDLGILKNSLIIKFFERLEKYIYKKADIITVHSEGNKKFLLNKKNQPDYKVKVIYNWINVSRFKNVSNKTNFRHKLGLNSKFIILFAGVLGPSQGLDTIIDVAEALQKENKIHFLFVGDGTEKIKLENRVKSLSLTNVSFHPFVAKENYPELLNEVDVGLVCLSSKNKTPVVPGKLMGYMAAGLPILAVLNKESDGHNIVKSASCGFSSLPENKKGIINSILELGHNKELREQFGERGSEFAQNNFSVEVCVGQYENIFEQLLKK